MQVKEVTFYIEPMRVVRLVRTSDDAMTAHFNQASVDYNIQDFRKKRDQDIPESWKKSNFDPPATHTIAMDLFHRATRRVCDSVEVQKLHRLIDVLMVD